MQLTLLDAGHRDLYRALYGSHDVMRTVGPPLSPEEADAMFARVLRHNGLALPGHRAWAVSAPFRQEPFGLAALVRTGDRAEFGMMLLPVAWRRGISRGVIGTLLSHAFGPMDLAHIDVSRPDDEYVGVLDRMFAPFRFHRCPGLRVGEVGWTLAREAWRREGEQPDPATPGGGPPGALAGDVAFWDGPTAGWPGENGGPGIQADDRG